MTGVSRPVDAKVARRFWVAFVLAGMTAFGMAASALAAAIILLPMLG